MTAEQVHQLGLDEVARIRGEMEALKDKVGFKGDLQAFFKLRRTPTSSSSTPTPMPAGRPTSTTPPRRIATIKQQLPNYFGLLPKADLVVKRVEPFREQSPAPRSTTTRARRTAARPGVYYAHLSDMNAMPKTELEVIAYHEGLPGHHMQIAIAQELSRRAGVPQAGRLHRLRRRLGPVFGMAGARDARHLHRPVLRVRPPDVGDVARDPPGGGHRPACQGLDRGAGGGLLPSQNSSIPQPAIEVGDPPLHHLAGPGDRLQDRHDQDPATAREGREASWAATSTSAASTTPSSAAARCRWTCWSAAIDQWIASEKQA